MEQESRNVNQFWDELRKVILAAGISESAAAWHLRWARDFAMSIKGRPLRERTAEDVEVYLSALSARKGIRNWQVKEAFSAIRIMYHGFLNIPLKFKMPVLEESAAAGTGRSSARASD